MTNFIILLLLSPTIILLNGGNNKSGVTLGTLERKRVAHTVTVNEIITALPDSQVSKDTVLVQLDTSIQQAAKAKGNANAQMLRTKVNFAKVHNGARKE